MNKFDIVIEKDNIDNCGIFIKFLYKINNLK